MRRRLPISRPYGWRYWTRRAARGVLATFVRGLLVLLMASVLLVLLSEVSTWPALAA